ncbi:hypothetical protein [Kocuria varians]|uniref:Secreted protein n=1 Tax=Kocuria varians TaxID=1272 RepID=A0A7D7Q3W7_KOCVA|nr:hypothetical protein [Kocuria varians]QMS57057.1 hypothetical protein CIB50_0001782 [Kocuria varians]
MGVWSKLALLAAGALVGGAATRVASDPTAREALARQVSGGAPGGEDTGGTLAARTAGDVERRPESGPVALLRGGARRLRLFRARVRAGMDERESELREQFGVRSPVDHTANHSGDDAVAPAGVPWHAVDPRPAADPHLATGPGDTGHRIIDHDPSEGNER